MTHNNWNTMPAARKTNAYGQIVLDDQDTSAAWWDHITGGSDTRPNLDALDLYVPVAVARNDRDESAKGSIEAALNVVRNPDMYDDGKAIWLHADCVVSVDVERMPQVVEVLTKGARHRAVPGGWVRIHPSHYGIDVDSFYDHGQGIEAHAADTAWMYAEQVIITG